MTQAITGFEMADAIFGALTKPAPVSNWTPLVNLVGAREAGDFMFMGTDGDLMLYKHVNTRRYLNINRISGRTFQFVNCPQGYKAIPTDEALAYVRS